MQKLRIPAIAIYLSLLLLAPFCAAHSCEWGNNVFFLYGCCCILLLIVFTALLSTQSGYKKLMTALLLTLLLILEWVVLFGVCDFRIMCRLF